MGFFDSLPTVGLFKSLTGSDEKNPADAAMPYLQQIPGMEKQYYNPYIEHGQEAYGAMNPIFSRMSSDPSAFLNELMKGYAPSKGYQLQRDEALRAAGNASAAGGTRGTPQDVEQASKISDILMGEDMQNWLKNVLNIEGSGLTGEQGLYNTGFEATKGLTGDLSNILGTQGQLAFQGQREENQRKSDMLGGLMKLIGAGAGAYFGGPTGAAIGANIGGSFI